MFFLFCCFILLFYQFKSTAFDVYFSFFKFIFKFIYIYILFWIISQVVAEFEALRVNESLANRIALAFEYKLAALKDVITDIATRVEGLITNYVAENPNGSIKIGPLLYYVNRQLRVYLEYTQHDEIDWDDVDQRHIPALQGKRTWDLRRLENMHISDILHSKGLPIRHIGLVRRKLTNARLRHRILVETISRVLKSLLRAKLRDGVSKWKKSRQSLSESDTLDSLSNVFSRVSKSSISPPSSRPPSISLSRTTSATHIRQNNRRRSDSSGSPQTTPSSNNGPLAKSHFFPTKKTTYSRNHTSQASVDSSILLQDIVSSIVVDFLNLLLIPPSSALDTNSCTISGNYKYIIPCNIFSL